MRSDSSRSYSLSMPERISVVLALLVLSVLAMSGCKSKQDEAVDAAKQQAIATGQPQQVTSVDKQGNTTVTTVMPPPAGQKDPVVSTQTVPVGQQPPAAATVPGKTAEGVAAVPEAGGQPVIAPLDLTVDKGTTLPIRIGQTMNVKTARAGDTFTGTVAEAITNDQGKVLIPRGTAVSGVISAAKKRGHFKGASYLSLRLTNMTLGGSNYALQTGRATETKKGKGKRSAAFIGGGAGVGMLIGGIATGGVGLLAGGLAGGGAGTLLGGLTGNKDLVIPAETIVRFKLADDLSVIPPQ